MAGDTHPDDGAVTLAGRQQDGRPQRHGPTPWLQAGRLACPTTNWPPSLPPRKKKKKKSQGQAQTLPPLHSLAERESPRGCPEPSFLSWEGQAKLQHF